MTLLEVQNLVKEFPIYSGIFRKQIGSVKAVQGVSFALKKGEILGVVGESGSGKSTLGKTAIGLILPTSGQIKFMNRPLSFDRKHLRILRKDVQMIFQDPYASLNPRKSIFTSLTEALVYHKLVNTKEELHTRALEVLHQIGLSEEILHHYPHEFSGGQQQRICIGRAIAMRPKLIICDEAVSALDVSVQAQILNLLFKIKEDLNLSYLFISHDLNVIRHFCDRILVMSKGKIVEEGTPHDLFTNPQHPYTKLLISSIF